MSASADEICATANRTRYRSGQAAGHYESFFLRANHPERPQAFWIRYTIFAPEARPQDAIGELWAVAFDGDTQRHAAVKREVSMAHCAFGTDRLLARIGDAELVDGRARGAAASGGHSIAWQLEFDGAMAPLLLLPSASYRARLPRAKTLVPLPMARFRGALSVDEARIEVADWIGSQNHNWGSRHTDQYAWGQVAGFDSHPDSFLEVATARMKLGPLWTPFMTLLVLRHRGEEIALNSLRQAFRARGRFGYFHWDFASAGPQWEVHGRIAAPASAFVGLRYFNPPGGSKFCLNSKIAQCELRVRRRNQSGASVEILNTAHRAAFEILTDDSQHGIAIVA